MMNDSKEGTGQVPCDRTGFDKIDREQEANMDNAPSANPPSGPDRSMINKYKGGK